MVVVIHVLLGRLIASKDYAASRCYRKTQLICIDICPISTGKEMNYKYNKKLSHIKDECKYHISVYFFYDGLKNI